MVITTKQMIGIFVLFTIINYGIWYTLSLFDVKDTIVWGSVMEVIGICMALICGLI